MRVNCYKWNEEVEKAFCGKPLTSDIISKISKHLYELANNTDEYTKNALIEKGLKYREEFIINNETEERTFNKAYLIVNDEPIFYDYYKLKVL